MIIYKITNKINNKIYVGQTSQTLEERWRRHCYKSNVDSMYISRAIQKYGKDNFFIEQIDMCETFQEANQKEIYYISYFNCLAPIGYNLLTGGDNSLLHETTKQKISQKLKGTIRSEQTLKKLSKAQKESYIKNPDRKKKISQSLCGRSFSSDNRQKLSKSKGESSLYVGVHQDSRRKRFHMNFFIHGKKISESYGDEIDAAYAYDFWCRNYNMVAVNFPDISKTREYLNNKRKVRKRRQSKYLGVAATPNGKYSAMLYDKKTKRVIYLGRFKTEDEAASAVNDHCAKNGEEIPNHLTTV